MQLVPHVIYYLPNTSNIYSVTTQYEIEKTDFFHVG